MENKSLWSFEQSADDYEMPNHNSENYIDVDFLRELLFIHNSNQKGIESLLWGVDDEKIDSMIDDIKKKFSELFHLKIKGQYQDIIRICFDYDNNLIMIKNNKGNEDNFYFSDLKSYESKIFEVLDLESFSTNELNEDVEIVLLLGQFEKMSMEEKMLFMKNHMQMKKYIEQLEKEVLMSRKLLSQLKKYMNE